MKIDEMKKMKNKDYIVLLPDFDYDIRESVNYSFDNVIDIMSKEKLDQELRDCFCYSYNYDNSFIVNNYSDDSETIINFVNKHCKSLILFDYCGLYRKILPYISKKVQIKWIFRYNMAELTQGLVRLTFHMITEFYDRDIVNTIGCLDESTYKVLKNSGYSAKYITLDIKTSKVKNKDSDSIGILSSDREPNHNFYNQLSALKLVNYSKVKLLSFMPATDHFVDFFNIKYKKCNTLDEVMKDNFVNLYVNFTFSNIEIILKSMDKGIPCILGNTDIFDEYPDLKKFLVLNSDDDINELYQKINNVKENKNRILKEYANFRKKYTKNSKKLINKFVK